MSVIMYRRAMVGYQHQCRARFDVFVATRRVRRQAAEVFLVASHLASGATGDRQRRARRRGAIDDRERPVGVGPLAQPIGNVHRSGIADNGDDRSRRPEFRRRGGADLRRTTLRRPQAGISLNPAAGIPSVRSAGEVPVADSSTPPARSSEVGQFQWSVHGEGSVEFCQDFYRTRWHEPARADTRWRRESAKSVLSGAS